MASCNCFNFLQLCRQRLSEFIIDIRAKGGDLDKVFHSYSSWTSQISLLLPCDWRFSSLHCKWLVAEQADCHKPTTSHYVIDDYLILS